MVAVRKADAAPVKDGLFLFVKSDTDVRAIADASLPVPMVLLERAVADIAHTLHRLTNDKLAISITLHQG
jgi:hypothetical protein